ncbi:pentapeptide repeat-containing protein [Virgibacillus sp. DJP39]|uniref:pentapeptide repeat-containing protein n=1 Tax=Virgibacillus sp. DJP39 TaxID=3409790 RepID=UPI003BB7F86C
MQNFNKEKDKAVKLYTQMIVEYEENYKNELTHFKKHYKIKEKEITGTKQYLKPDCLNMEDKDEFIFHTVKNKFIGKDTALFEEHYLVISGIHIDFNKFVNCDFRNVVFKNCTLAGNKFVNCLFRDVIFDNCRFSRHISHSDVLKDIKLFTSIFDECTITAKFKETYLEGCAFNASAIILTDYNNTDLQGTLFLDTTLFTVKITDCDLRDSKFVKIRCNQEFVIEDDQLTTKFNENTFIGPLKTKENDDDTYRIYKTFAEQFKKNVFLEHYGEYFYLYNKYKIKELSGFKKIYSFFVWSTIGFGERITHAVIFSIVVILIWSFLFSLSGIRVDEKFFCLRPTFIISDMLSLKEVWNIYIQIINYSFTNFFGISINADLSGMALLFSYVQKVIGLVMFSLFTSVLIRKMIR